jgi:hypothetical protein
MEHIQGMNDDRLPPKKLNYKPEGRRNIGRPQGDGKTISGRKEQAKRSKPHS